jgi:hypothetical protein
MLLLMILSVYVPKPAFPILRLPFRMRIGIKYSLTGLSTEYMLLPGLPEEETSYRRRKVERYSLAVVHVVLFEERACGGACSSPIRHEHLSAFKKESIDMDSAEIDTCLQALDEELGHRPVRKPVRLTVVGGVYMLYFLRNRASTKDVNVVPLDFPDTTQPNKETRAFRAAVNAVAKKYQLRRDWLNDVVAAFIPPPGPLTLWRAYTHLYVYVPQADFMLVLKLLAGRKRDADDIAALCRCLDIHTREHAQALVDRYADRQWQRECMLEVTLDAIF